MCPFREPQASHLSSLLHCQRLYTTEGGFVYDCTRDDRQPFYGGTLDIKYHAV